MCDQEERRRPPKEKNWFRKSHKTQPMVVSSGGKSYYFQLSFVDYFYIYWQQFQWTPIEVFVIFNDLRTMDTIGNSSTTPIPSNGTTSTTTVMPFLPIEEGIVNSNWPMIAGIFAWTALLVSIWEISAHLSNYNKPYLQKYVVRILWMVPIYALNSVRIVLVGHV